MGCCSFGKLRSSLLLLNIVYMMIAFILIGVPAFAYSMSYVTNYSLIGSLIGAGVFLFLFSFLGVCGALHHHQVLLFFYMVVLGLLCIIQFATSVALVAVSEEEQVKLLNTSWVQAENSSRVQIQETFDCCGFDQNLTDAMIPPLNCSTLNCCTDLYKIKEEECYFSNSTQLGCHACYHKEADQFSYAVKMSGTVGLIFSFTEVIGIVLAIQYRNTKDPSRSYSFPGHGGFAKQ